VEPVDEGEPEGEEELAEPDEADELTAPEEPLLEALPEPEVPVLPELAPEFESLLEAAPDEPLFETDVPDEPLFEPVDAAAEVLTLLPQARPREHD
jgi:hypothetical protein